MAPVCENLHQRIAPVLERDREIAERSRAETVGPNGRERRLAFAARETQRLRDGPRLGEPLECVFRQSAISLRFKEAFEEFSLAVSVAGLSTQGENRRVPAPWRSPYRRRAAPRRRDVWSWARSVAFSAASSSDGLLWTAGRDAVEAAPTASEYFK